jgi:hypothetical protein
VDAKVCFSFELLQGNIYKVRDVRRELIVCPSRNLPDGPKEYVCPACANNSTAEIMDVFPAFELMPLMDLFEMADSLPGFTRYALTFR